MLQTHLRHLRVETSSRLGGVSILTNEQNGSIYMRENILKIQLSAPKAIWFQSLHRAIRRSLQNEQQEFTYERIVSPTDVAEYASG